MAGLLNVQSVNSLCEMKQPHPQSFDVVFAAFLPFVKIEIALVLSDSVKIQTKFVING